MNCKYCGSTNMKRYGTYNGEQLWWCDDCERKQTDKDTLFKMRFPSYQIATAVRLYYEGLSLDAIKEEFQHQFNKTVATSTLYEWIQEFTNEAIAREEKRTMIKRILSQSPSIGEYMIGLISLVWCFGFVGNKALEKIQITVIQPTIFDVIEAGFYSIFAIWLLWIAFRVFGYYASAILSGYHFMCCPPMEPAGKNNKDNVCSTKQCQPEVDVPINQEERNS